MTDSLRALFALLETEEEDFGRLAERFGIDPAIDLQNCDLTGVDFGALKADTLNLTGAELSGANLTKVRCRSIIGVDGSATGSPVGPLVEVLTAISRYQNADWAINQIFQSVTENHASPVLAFYHTAAEQDLLTKRVCAHFGDGSHVQEGFNAHASGTKLLWFYSKAERSQFKLNPASLDKSFFETLRSSNKSADIGIYPYRANQSAIERIRDGVHPGTYDQMRSEFVRGLRRELEMRVLNGSRAKDRSMLIFSGFPPISKRFYEQLRENISGRLYLIFLCSSNWQPEYLRGKGLHWRRVAIPRYSIGEPLTAEEDIGRLVRRIGVASGGRIHIDETMTQWMAEWVGKPLVEFKRELTRELSKAVARGG
ncbi:pentapeptide repeat-containing protein [Bradyrhizobium guangzhouense]|uniref:Pentapeptide repeat-containing protein n=1 Tax=Bradyrhizobium guangzhouense TaxID=1325095 RepID=A0AAE5X5N6_9BRAD|nr:pentapeptide repeat-containing protein [Bradyrhizobium guangzhouense]QAU49098.1 hypothetical protein XH91_29560 [Bradyrhizobium guangzhouense]RXH03820.1 hypothetical protein EAS56_37795 [Bradyrhizobium guangzhouense]